MTTTTQSLSNKGVGAEEEHRQTEKERHRAKRQSSFTCKHKMSGNCKTAAIPTTSGKRKPTEQQQWRPRSQDIHALEKNLYQYLI